MLFEALLYACKVFQEKEKIKKINEIIFFVEVRISNNIFMFFFVIYDKLLLDYIEVKQEVLKEDEIKETWDDSKIIILFYFFCFLY